MTAGALARIAPALLPAIMPALGAVTGWKSGEGRPAATTLSRMADVVNGDYQRADVFEAATRIVRDVDGRDLLGQAAALLTWLRANTRFVRDPVADELLRAPSYMLAMIRRDGRAMGDCDDLAMLGAALAKSIGFQPTFIAEAYSGGPLAPLVHVYTVIPVAPGVWRSLDTQLGPDVQPVRPVRRVTREV